MCSISSIHMCEYNQLYVSKYLNMYSQQSVSILEYWKQRQICHNLSIEEIKWICQNLHTKDIIIGKCVNTEVLSIFTQSCPYLSIKLILTGRCVNTWVLSTYLLQVFSFAKFYWIQVTLQALHRADNYTLPIPGVHVHSKYCSMCSLLHNMKWKGKSLHSYCEVSLCLCLLCI